MFDCIFEILFCSSSLCQFRAEDRILTVNTRVGGDPCEKEVAPRGQITGTKLVPKSSVYFQATDEYIS